MFNRKSNRHVISLLLALCLMLSSFSVAFGAAGTETQSASANDIKGNWAESEITSWLNQGFVKGYEDGSFKPNNAITRSEFFALINRSFGFTETADIAFTDIKKSDWDYSEVQKAVKAGYIKGFVDHTIRTKNQISRQEVAVIVASLLQLSASEESANSFTDAAAIPAWSKGAIGAAVAKNILKGFDDKSFKPLGLTTRAEAVVVLDRALKSDTAAAYGKAGTYGPATGSDTINGDVVISAAGVTLQNTVITGNLLLDAGIGNGDVFLKNVSVKGTTTIKGGGEHSVHLENSVLITVIIDKVGGTVRVVAEGSTTVETVVVQTPVTLEESDLTGTGFNNVKLTNLLPANSIVTLNGIFGNVDVLAASISIEIPSGSVKLMTVSEAASGATINVVDKASIVKLVLDAVAKVLGKGTIEAATLSVAAQSGTTFETRPNSVDNVGSTPTPSGGGGGYTPVDYKNVTSVDGASFNASVNGNEITISSGSAKLTSGSNKATKVIVNSGATLYDYWNAGEGTEVVVNAGGKLAWGENHLLVGTTGDKANLILESGTFNITGAANNAIAAYTLNGNATVQQVDTNPFLVAANEQFIIAAGKVLTVAAAMNADLTPNQEAVLSIDSRQSKLVVMGTLEVEEGARVVLGNGSSSLWVIGGIINNDENNDETVPGYYGWGIVDGAYHPVNIDDSIMIESGDDATFSATVVGDKVTILTGTASLTTSSNKAAKVIVNSGATLYDYWNVGKDNEVEVKAGGKLAWGEGNLLVGKAGDAANLILADGTFTITGAASNKIATYLLNGNATVQQVNTNPFVVGKDEEFIIASGKTLTVAAMTNPTTNQHPVLSVHSNGGKLYVNGTLKVLEGSRVVLGNGAGSIRLDENGTIDNAAGNTDTETNLYNWGIVDGSHLPVTVTPTPMIP